MKNSSFYVRSAWYPWHIPSMSTITLEPKDLLLCGPFDIEGGSKFLFVMSNLVGSHHIYTSVYRGSGLTTHKTVTCESSDYVNAYLIRIQDALLPPATDARAYKDGWLDISIGGMPCIHIPAPKKLWEATEGKDWIFNTNNKWEIK